ncbi:MAG TPA: EAL domain-containing protein [Gallionella sp.]|nr:EAL domain-containing protein [Gallionella sp.]
MNKYLTSDISQNTTERKHAETLLGGQNQVLEMIATGKSLPGSLTELIRLIEAQLPGMLGSILLLDEDGVHVRHGAAPSLPAEFIAAVDGQPIGPIAGSCGTAAYRKEAVYVEDIATDPLWESYKAEALQHGFRASWSTPIFDAQGQMLGTFAMYYRQTGLPKVEHLQLIDIATHIAAIAISHHRKDEALHESEARYSQLFEYAPDGIAISDLEGDYHDANASMCKMLGYTRDEMLELNAADIVVPTEIQHIEPAIDAIEAGTDYQREWQLRRKDGSVFAAEVKATMMPDGKVLGVISDITERKTAEAKVQRLTQLYAALSQCNQAIVRCANEVELFPQICRDAVKFGGMKMAWIGMIDETRNLVRPVASFGTGIEYLNGAEISIVANSPSGMGPTGTAIRDNQPYWCQDFQHDPTTIAWHERGEKFGWGASASLPLYRKGVVVGAFGLYADVTNAFDEAAQNLLIEMAMDISFALDNFENTAERNRALEKIKYQNTVLQTQQETSLDGILVVDEHGTIISYNQKFIDLWRLPEALVSARRDEPVLKFVLDQIEDAKAFAARVQYLYEHHTKKSHDEILLKDGRIVDRYSAPVIGPHGEYYGRVWYFRDITERKQSERVVRDSQKRFKAIFDQAPIAIALLDAQGHPIISNSPLSKMVGYSNDELSKMTFSDFTYPEDVDNDLNQFTELMEGKISAYHMEKRYVHKDGHLIWANLFVTILRDEHGIPQDVIGMAEDITERKAAEARIKYLSRVQAVLGGINALIVRVQDRDELFREACQIVVDKGGFRMALVVFVDPVAKKVISIASAGKDEELSTLIKDRLSSSVDVSNTMVGLAISGKQPVVSNDSLNDPRLAFRNKYAESGVRSLVVLPLMVADEAVGTIALYASEIEFFHEEEMMLLTELAGDIAFAIDHIGKQEKLNYLAYYDVLTGLANRSLFLERVSLYMRSATSGGHHLAIGLIDLERFKNINDSLGRTVGDTLLRQVAEWLTYKTGDANLLARIDADHFAVVLPEVMRDGDLVRLVEKTMEAFLQHPFRLNNTVFRISVRVGIALFPDDGTDADTLFRNAEAALKKAKSGGDRYLFYTQKMTAAVAGKLTLENQLRQAIDNEEFVLHYQPKVNMVSGKVTSAEALIRWNDPRTGLVPPGKFIPILEETGLIYEVGRWALRQAIEDYLRWRAMGLPAVRIAVNVSPMQLRSHDFVAEIGRKTSIDPHAAEGLELEITESLIMEDVKHSVASLQAIRAMGITIVIDDFGTGFSSLSYLAKLPVDSLKIDRSFVVEMDVPQGLALVSSIITLAHSLKLKVVAEGVETEQQSRQLLSLNCDEMQGFLFSKPVPTEIFEARFLAPPRAG